MLFLGTTICVSGLNSCTASKSFTPDLAPQVPPRFMLAVHSWTSCRQQTGPSQPQLFSLCPLSWQDSLLPVPGPTLHSSPWPVNGWHSVVYISRMFFGLPFSWYRLAWPSPAGPPGRAQPCTLPSRLSPPQSTLYCQQASPHVWPTGHQASSPHSWGPLSPRVGLTLYCLQDPHWPHTGEVWRGHAGRRLVPLLWRPYHLVLTPEITEQPDPNLLHVKN